MQRYKTRRLVLLAVLVSFALVLNYFERFIPIAITIPGVKLGLANVVSLIALSFFSFWQVLGLVILRTLLGALFYTGFSAFLFSFAGGVLSLCMMAIMHRWGKNHISTIGISITGAVSHNFGQVLVAMVILNNVAIISYLPVLLVSAVITGVLIGVVADRSISYLFKHAHTLKVKS